MFTGLVSAIGKVRRADNGHFDIASPYAHETIALGASICCSGCCLTATHIEPDGAGGSVFTVEASNETLGLTTLSEWKAGQDINLERSLKVGDELGGHIVSGHVDGIAAIVSLAQDGASRRFEIECPATLAKFVAAKGSVALDGVSLTVNLVEDNRFTVNLIPHTLDATNCGQKSVGDHLNIEVDLMARYVARLAEKGSAAA
ncbi:MAG: riboflavin synthase [Hyphomicrobiales bacterium]|nr:riboflavin synthase [Hyphomicrobiales bacterium]